MPPVTAARVFPNYIDFVSRPSESFAQGSVHHHVLRAMTAYALNQLSQSALQMRLDSRAPHIIGLFHATMTRLRLLVSGNATYVVWLLIIFEESSAPRPSTWHSLYIAGDTRSLTSMCGFNEGMATE